MFCREEGCTQCCKLISETFGFEREMTASCKSSGCSSKSIVEANCESRYLEGELEDYDGYVGCETGRDYRFIGSSSPLLLSSNQDQEITANSTTFAHKCYIDSEGNAELEEIAIQNEDSLERNNVTMQGSDSESNQVNSIATCTTCCSGLPGLGQISTTQKEEIQIEMIINVDACIVCFSTCFNCS